MSKFKKKAIGSIMEWAVGIAGPTVIMGMIFYIYLKSNAAEIKENWVQYRCNPIYMPFAGMFTDSPLQNFQFCTMAMAQTLFDGALVPIHVLFSLMTKTIQIVLDQMNSFRAFVTGIQTFILSFANNIFGKLSNTVGVVIHLLSTVRDLTSRIVTSGAYAAVIMSTGVNYVLSVFSFIRTLLKSLVGLIFGLAIILLFVFPPLLFFFIPIGIAIGVSYDGGCFHPNTPVDLADGSTIPISKVRVGDVLSNNATVLATMRFTPKEALYMYRSMVCVSGSHLVRDSDGVWRRVQDSPNSVAYTGEVPSEVICLNTSNHKMYIRNCVFADYDEMPPTATLPEPLHAFNTIRRKSDNARVKLWGCYPGMETVDSGTLRAVIRLGCGRYQVIVDHPSGMVRIDDSRWVRDYLGEEHDPLLYDASQKKALCELNRNIHNNDEG